MTCHSATAADRLPVAAARLLASFDRGFPVKGRRMGQTMMGPIVEAMRLLGLNNRQMAELMGISKRSIQRWYNGEGFPIGPHYERIARALHPKHPEIAARMATVGGTTLVAMGLEKPPHAPAPAASYTAPAAARALVAPAMPGPEHVDSVVSAAADVLDVSPRAVRAAFAAAFARARELGVAIEPLVGALSSPSKPAGGAAK